jgi:hypothetical protein
VSGSSFSPRKSFSIRGMTNSFRSGHGELQRASGALKPFYSRSPAAVRRVKNGHLRGRPQPVAKKRDRPLALAAGRVRCDAYRLGRLKSWSQLRTRWMSQLDPDGRSTPSLRPEGQGAIHQD